MAYLKKGMRVGFNAMMAAQRAYIIEGERPSRFGLFIPKVFVRGIRDLGYRSTGGAIAELIDNAIQACADRVDILFGYEGTASGKKPTQLAVVDNGHGMEPAMIRIAMMWGGTHRENDRTGLGRYGYGLPCASVSLGRRFTVYSRSESGPIHAVTLDLDELMAGSYTDTLGEIIVSPSVEAKLPSFVVDHLDQAYPAGWTSGTVVVIEKLDRLEWVTIQGLRDNLCRQFGVTYHKLRGETALYVDSRFVEPIDPLFLTPEFLFYALDEDRAQAFDPVGVEAHDPASGAYLGTVTLRYAWLPPSFGSIDNERDAVGVNANARFPIIKDCHGVIFSRNGRLIDVQTRTPWTTFINNDRYIKVEVEFSASLDEAFGITTSKQQVTISPFAWDLLHQAGLPKAIEQLRTKVKQAKLDRRIAALAPPAGKRRISERAMSAAMGMSKDDVGYAQWGLDLRVSPYRTEFEHVPGSAFFRKDWSHGACTLHINTAHRFYTDLYDGPASTLEVRSALEVVLFSIGDIALDQRQKSDGKLADELVSWSRRLDQALEMLASHLGDAEQQDVGDRVLADSLS
jgi:hypothetical protein